MARRLVSPLRISTVPLAIVVALSGVLAVVLWRLGPSGARYAFLIPVAMFTGLQLAAAAALARAVQAFADEVRRAGAPEPVVDASRDGDVVAQWPDWGLAVGGTVSRFHVRQFGFQVGAERVPLRLLGAREGARAALHLAGRGGGVVGAYDGSLPGALGVGPFVAVAVAGGIATASVALLLSWALGAAVGAAVVLASLSALLSGHVVHRRALRAYLDRLVRRGVRVDPPVRVWNGFAPRYVVPTSEGALLVGWLSLWRLPRLFVVKGGVELPRSWVYASAQ